MIHPIIECAAHPVRPEEDCDYCKQELDLRTEQLQSKANDNSKKLNQLRMAGLFPDTVMLDLRLTMLLQSILNLRQQVQFEEAFHANLQGLLDNALLDLAKSKIVRPSTIDLNRVAKRRNKG